MRAAQTNHLPRSGNARPQGFIVLAIAILGGLATGAGCSADVSSGSACVLNSDCPEPLSCIEGACRQECRNSGDCEEGQICHEQYKVCRAATGCNDSANPCPLGQVCSIDGQCIDTSGSHETGTTPTPRDTGSSVPVLDQGVPYLDTQVAPADDRATPPPPPDDSATPPPPPDDAAVSPPDAAIVRGHKGYGESCVCPSDCESGFCVENKMRGARTCTERCDRHIDCPDIDTCLMAEVRGGPGADCPPFDNGLEQGQVVGVCYPNETGFPCGGPEDCTGGICLQIGPPVPWADPADMCVVKCDTNDKCPSGYVCQVSAGIDGDGKICVPDLSGFAPCQSPEVCGGICPVAAGVDEASIVICAATNGSDTGYCTCSCLHAEDCPRGYACDQTPHADADPARPGQCSPVAGLICPNEATGNIPDPMECMSFYCMAGGPENPGYSRCTSICNVDRDCPADYSCQLVPDGNPNTPDLSACTPR